MRWILGLWLVSATALAVAPLSKLTAVEQQQYQWDQMVRSRYRNGWPGYFWGGCRQAVSAMSFPLQIAHTFINKSAEKAWWAKLLIFSKMFHNMGIAAPIEFVTEDGVVLQGMGRLSLGAPPIAQNFVPGFGFVLYEQGQDPVGVQTIHSLTPQKDFRWFLHDLSNKIDHPAPGTLSDIVDFLGYFIRNPLHLATRPLLDRLKREGADISPFADASHVKLRGPDGLREDPQFLTQDFRVAFRHWKGFGEKQVIYEVFIEMQDGSEKKLGEIRLKPGAHFYVSRYADYTFHIPHYTGP